MLIKENELRNLIRDSYLSTLLESKDCDKEIVALILSLKDLLLNKNFVCHTEYIAPSNDRKYRDYGYFSIRVDHNLGRAKSMKNKTLSKVINKFVDKIGLYKYFTFLQSSFDGKYCDCSFKLKPKYVSRYINTE